MNGKYFLSVIVPFSILLPIFIGSIKLKALPGTARIVLGYLFFSAVINAAAIIVGRYFHQNNLPLVHLFTVIEAILFIWYYKKLYGASKSDLFYVLVAAAFTTLCIINAIFFQSIYTYSSYSRSLEAITCMLFALNYFAKLASAAPGKKIAMQPDFYFNCGIFLYFSGAFMLFVFSNFIITNLSSHNFYIIWTMHAALTLLMYIFFSIAFLLCKK